MTEMAYETFVWFPPSQNVKRRNSVEPAISSEDVFFASKISKLRSSFVFEKNSVVIDFFKHNYSLVDWLMQGRAILVKHFGGDARFVLKAVNGICRNDEQHLVVYIQTQMAVEEAMENLDKFDTEWFFDQIDFVGDKVIFNLAFV